MAMDYEFADNNVWFFYDERLNKILKQYTHIHEDKYVYAINPIPFIRIGSIIIAVS